MTEANMENLSAAMDGELSREELRFLLRRLDHDDSLLEVWGSLSRRQRRLASPAARRGRFHLRDARDAAYRRRTVRFPGSSQAPGLAAPFRGWRHCRQRCRCRIDDLAAHRPRRRSGQHRLPPTWHRMAAPHRRLQSVAASTRSNAMLAAVPPSLSAYSASGLSQQGLGHAGRPIRQSAVPALSDQQISAIPRMATRP